MNYFILQLLSILVSNITVINQMLIEEFELEDLLGSGSYAQVYKARHRETNRVCAIKILSSEPCQDVLDKIMKEMNIMIQCENEHIVRCFGSEINDYGICLFLQYCKGSVSDLVKSSPNLRLSEYHIASILRSVLEGLDYLHANKKIHRDIKAANILINDGGQIKLGDFGVSAELIHTHADKDTTIGSPFWMSPQIIGKAKYNYKTDIWSLGITAIELAERTPPYSHLHPIRAMFAIQNNPPKQLSDPSLWSQQFNSFVRKCLTVEPSLRPTARQLLQHPFIVSKAKSSDILAELLKTCSANLSKSKKDLNKQNFQINQSVNDSGTMIEHSKPEDYQPFWQGKTREESSEAYNTMVEKQYESEEEAQFMKFFKKPQLTEEEKYKAAKKELESLNGQMVAQINAIKENYKAQMKKYQDVVRKFEVSKVQELQSKQKRMSLRKPTLDKNFKVKKDGSNNCRVRTEINEQKQTVSFEFLIRKEKQRQKQRDKEKQRQRQKDRQRQRQRQRVKDQQNQYYELFMRNAKQPKEQRQQKGNLNYSNKTIEKIYSVIKTQNLNKTTKELFRR